MGNDNFETPEGFLFAVAEASIKKPGKKDLAIIYTAEPSAAAGVFTKNRVKAAPVVIDAKRMRKSKGQAIIVNSGNANACTGEQGMKDALMMSRRVAELLKIDEEDVFVCSTGVIGTPLPMDRIIPKLDEAVQNLGKATLNDVAEAIMTTDTFAKKASTSFKVKGAKAVLAGVAKGAGMISPNMATTLGLFVTDLSIASSSLKATLKESVEQSFNRIVVDGEMSTNDTVLILANGMAKNETVTDGTEELKVFRAAFDGLSSDLAKMIVKDGEGATKIFTIHLKGAGKEKEALKFARSVARSPLVKTAVYGNDPNWGRIVTALGYAGPTFNHAKMDIFIGPVKIVSSGITTNRDLEAVEILKKKEFDITIDLKSGHAMVSMLTCDLTEEYIKINSEYKT